MVLLAAVLVAGCAARQGQGVFGVARASEPGMSCTQATQVARAALFRMGYTITKVEPAEAGKPGKVVGRRDTGWAAATPESGTQYMALVKIICSSSGAQFEAVTDESFSARLAFRRKFSSTIAEMAQRRVRPPRIDDTPQQGLSITVQPQRHREAAAEFGADLIALGITPVQVRIANRTPRTYGFSRDDIRLVTEEGKRVGPLALGTAVAKLEGEARASLEAKLIAEGDLSPGETRSGFVYFPAYAYRKAKVTVVDRENDETEGFSIEF